MKEVEKAIKRIQEIKFEDVNYNKQSYRILMSEFIRRGNAFKEKYIDKERRHLAIFNAANSLNIKIPDEIIELVDNMNLLTKYGWSREVICRAYIEWMYLIDVGNKIALSNSDLYEPIIKLLERGGVFSYHQNELLCGRFAWPKNYHSLFKDAEEFNISDDYLDNIDKLDFILYMKAKNEDSICNYMSNRGYKLYKIDGTRIGSIEEFFTWVRAEFPQDPPLPDKCNFNALIDSLWGGFDTLGEEKVAIIWSNPAKLMNADKQSFEILINCFRELSESLVEGDYGMNQPVCLKTIFL